MKEQMHEILMNLNRGRIAVSEAQEQLLDLFSVSHSALLDDLKVTNALYEERQKLLDAIPECEIHGKCVPHALEWIENAKQHCG